MSFVDAVRSCLSKYVDFSGRARRSEFWWFHLAMILVGIAGLVIDSTLEIMLVQPLVLLGLFLPLLAAGVRRLHDTDRSGWLLLLVLIPVVNIVLIVFLVLDGTPVANRFGPSPKLVGENAYGSPA